MWVGTGRDSWSNSSSRSGKTVAGAGGSSLSQSPTKKHVVEFPHPFWIGEMRVDVILFLATLAM